MEKDYVKINPADTGRCINVGPWLDIGCNVRQLKANVETKSKADIVI